jgi:hypothetical protein
MNESLQYGGFEKAEQESRYLQTVFELLHILASRVNASLKLSKTYIFKSTLS